jgi:hypothetical protein
MKKNSIFWGLAVLLIALVLQSCATVFGGRHNTLVFTNPENIPAEVFVDDTLVGNAEGKLYYQKEYFSMAANSKFGQRATKHNRTW